MLPDTSSTSTRLNFGSGVEYTFTSRSKACGRSSTTLTCSVADVVLLT